jgi:hypothetical protein
MQACGELVAKSVKPECTPQKPGPEPTAGRDWVFNLSGSGGRCWRTYRGCRRLRGREPNQHTDRLGFDLN